MKTPKAERLMNLVVMLLESHRPVTAEEVQETVPGYGQESDEAFKRMFERDKDELREMGIPVETQFIDDPWESKAGYRIPKEKYYLPEIELEPDEAAALCLAAGLVRNQDPGAIKAALMKLSDEIQSDSIDSKPYVSADLGLTAPNLPKAFEAVSERRTVKFTYESASGVKPRVLDPYGLIHRKGVWYLVGRDHASDDVRSFRLGRIRGSLRVADAGAPGNQYQIPEGFEASTVLDAPPFVQGEPIEEARVKFDRATAWWVERSTPWLHLSALEDGSAEATVAISDPRGFVSWVLGFGEGAEVTEPPAMRAEVLARLEAML